MVETVWVLRHGQRQDTVDPDWATHADRVHDPGLTDHGHWQAERSGERLREEGIEEIYASPFLRATQTANHVAESIEQSVRLEDGLGEYLNPEWFDEYPDTLSHDELGERFPRIDREYSSLLEPSFPETHDEAERRIGEVARQIVAETSAERVLLVGHGATIGGVTAGLVGSTDSLEAPLTGLTELRQRENEWHVIRSGDTDHLET